MRPVVRRVVALTSMVAGCVGVAGLLYYMNELTKPPAPDTAEASRDFVVEKQPRKQERPKPPPKTAPKKAVRVARHAPAPNVTTGLSGLSFDLPQFEAADLGAADELLGGSEASKKLVMTEETVDELPRPRSQKPPDYPAKARQRGIQGHVTVKLRVSERGDVQSVKVLEADPAGVFEGVTVAAAREWMFEPAKYKGEPVAISVQQRVPFRLN